MSGHCCSEASNASFSTLHNNLHNTFDRVCYSDGNLLRQISNGVIAAGVGVAAEGHAVVGGVPVDATTLALEALRVHPRV